MSRIDQIVRDEIACGTHLDAIGDLILERIRLKDPELLAELLEISLGTANETIEKHDSAFGGLVGCQRRRIGLTPEVLARMTVELFQQPAVLERVRQMFHDLAAKYQ